MPRNEVNYLFSKKLQTFGELAVMRMQLNLGAVLLLKGEPGGGKTEFAMAMAKTLATAGDGAARNIDDVFFKYQCAPDRERDLLYNYDMNGIVTRSNAWLPGPAWEAFESSNYGFSVLLIDEVDKTHPNFDAFLLELLEQMQFRAPTQGEDGRVYNIKANPKNLMIILTSNGRRELRQEVLRRCQRIEVPFPERPRLDHIIRGITENENTNVPLPIGLLELLIRIGGQIRKENPENAPSPKEMALCGIDLMVLGSNNVTDPDLWREVAASYMIKEGGVQGIDRALKFRWGKALMTEVFNPRETLTTTYETKYPIKKQAPKAKRR